METRTEEEEAIMTPEPTPDQPTEPTPNPECHCDLCEQRRRDEEMAKLLAAEPKEEQHDE
jgi:hypothetical protein